MPLRALFGDFPKARLEQDPAVIFALDSGLRLIYGNPAWDRFAAENGGTPERLKEKFFGQPILTCVPEELQEFYTGLYRQVTLTRGPAQHTYECSSAKSFRLFNMRLVPLRDGAGIVCINSLVADEPHSRAPSLDLVRNYVEDGLITMCSHCRRTRRPAEDLWDWVPGFVENPPDVLSFSLCPICADYYKAERMRWRAAAG